MFCTLSYANKWIMSNQFYVMFIYINHQRNAETIYMHMHINCYCKFSTSTNFIQWWKVVICNIGDHTIFRSWNRIPFYFGLIQTVEFSWTTNAVTANRKTLVFTRKRLTFRSPLLETETQFAALKRWIRRQNSFSTQWKQPGDHLSSQGNGKHPGCHSWRQRQSAAEKRFTMSWVLHLFFSFSDSIAYAGTATHHYCPKWHIFSDGDNVITHVQWW